MLGEARENSARLRGLSAPFPLEVLAGLLVFGVIGGVGYYLYRAANLEARKSMCNANMFQILTAMRRYQSEFGSLPPAAIRDQEGRPLHSWRILLLRYFDPELYAAYDFKEPWNGPKNRKLSARIPRYYRCPSDTGANDSWTSYVVVVGKETAFPPDRTTSVDDIRDGAATTIIVAETTVSGIDWMEPRDLDFASMSFRVNDRDHPGVSSNDLMGPVMAFANWKIWRLSKRNDLGDTLRALLTRQGGKPIDKESLIQTHALAY
jgi:hypothetical protein